MRILVGLYRLAVAVLCFAGTYEGWLLGVGNRWVYFTFQTNFVLGIVMLWAGLASLLRGIQPPAWLKGCLTLYIIVTGLVAWLVLPPQDPTFVTHIYGVMTTSLAHIVVPIMATADFLLFDRHRRFAWHYCLTWLIYVPFYLVFVLVRAALWPHSGPGAGGNPYPYGFIDLNALGWEQIGVNILYVAVAFLVLAALLVLVDRILPERTPLTG